MRVTVEPSARGAATFAPVEVVKPIVTCACLGVAREWRDDRMYRPLPKYGGGSDPQEE